MVLGGLMVLVSKSFAVVPPRIGLNTNMCYPTFLSHKGLRDFICNFAKLSMGRNVQREEANSDFRGSFKSIDTSIKLS